MRNSKETHGLSRQNLGYEQTLMYGRFTKELEDFAREEGKLLRAEESRRIKEDLEKEEEFGSNHGVCATKVASFFRVLWAYTFSKFGEEWAFLALLGLIMACLSFLMDTGSGFCNRARFLLTMELATVHPALQYFVWILLPICLILFTAGFVTVISPQAIGSGIPEMKTLLRGVTLKEYLTFRTLVAKVIGLTATLGSGMPYGKEGPLVHIGCTVATLLAKLLKPFQGIYDNESRTSAMLAAACAVGVASCFAAPIGGVLFSIEVTTVYFAVRNYWHGFFGAVCSATFYRLLAVWFQKETTVTAIFGTNFANDFPYDPQELIAFGGMGVFCGVGGALYVWCHRKYVLFIRQNQKLSQFLQKHRLLYPFVVTLVTMSICFPLGLGQFMAGGLNSRNQIVTLFSNFTWTKEEFNTQEQSIIRHWKTNHSSVFASLVGFILFNFFLSITASTLPVPAGSFIPVFKIGAGIGRIVGEIMHLLFPLGVRYGGIITPIIPGGYATVGAAAFTGAVTQTLSTSLIVVEMTGQITHFVPTMISVLIANATASLLQPSLYNSVIMIKKLPYLPDILPSSSVVYSIYVQDFMVREVKFIWFGMTYHELKGVIQENKNLRVFPLVDNPESMILLGSMRRREIMRLIQERVGRDRRLRVAAIWQKQCELRALHEFERRVQEEVEKRQRRPSRFEVTRAELEIQEPSLLELKSEKSPQKSILKRSRSFNSRYRGSDRDIPETQRRMKLVIGSIFKTKTPKVFSENEVLNEEKGEIQVVPADNERTPLKRVQLPRIIDMTTAEQKAWEEHELAEPVNFEECQIDPAPLQLVERTSLLKVHSMFSMVGVDQAYVTTIGRLVGVVGLKELRKVISEANAGTFVPQSQPEKAEEVEVTEENGETNSEGSGKEEKTR